MIGFIGGTGKQGRALALRIAALSNETVLLGSRNLEKAHRAVEMIKELSEDAQIEGVLNQEAARRSKVLFVTLPHGKILETLEELGNLIKGKIIVDVTNPLMDNHSHGGLSVSEVIQQRFPDSKVVCAFKNVSSYVLWDLLEPVEMESIICSDHEAAKEKILELSGEIGVRAVDGGRLENALASELLTRLLLDINRRTNSEIGIKFVTYPKK